MQSQTILRRVTRVRHPLLKRTLRVVRVGRISPHFMSVTFHDDSLASFVSASFDDHVKFLFEDSAGNPIRRDYTPRRFDLARRELTLEFALHEAGPASDWARQVQVGALAAIGGPKSSMIIPTDYDWHLLAGDASALPAIHRRIEELPRGSRVVALIEVPDPADRRSLAGNAEVETHWVTSPGEFLARLPQCAQPAGTGFAWCAGEAGTMALAREILLNELGLGREHTRVAAYWKRGTADHHQTLDT